MPKEGNGSLVTKQWERKTKKLRKRNMSISRFEYWNSGYETWSQACISLTWSQACMLLSLKTKGSGDGEENQRGKKRKKGNLGKV